MPKYLSLRLEPASGSRLPALGGGRVTQVLHVVNSLAGTKPLVMRLRLGYSRGGVAQAAQVEVNTFPPGM